MNIFLKFYLHNNFRNVTTLKPLQPNIYCNYNAILTKEKMLIYLEMECSPLTYN